MKNFECKEEFINLRAEGYSFDYIANKTGTSKNTLLKWSKLYNEQIEQQKQLALNVMVDKYKLSRLNKLELFTSSLSMDLKFKLISLRLPIELYKQMNKVISEFGLSKTRIIERALILYFKEVEKTGRP